MLNKISENILQVLIKKCADNPDREVTLSENDFVFPKMRLNLLYSACSEMYKDDYIKTISILYPTSKNIEVTLTYKGYCYFESKKAEKKEFLKRFLLSKISDVIVAFITSVLVNMNWNAIANFLRNLFMK